jgi:uncharacterized protein
MSAAQPDEAQVLAEIVRRVLTVTDPDKIILFGSRARGEARPDSDYDILVIGPSDERQSRRTAPLYLEGVGPEDCPVGQQVGFMGCLQCRPGVVHVGVGGLDVADLDGEARERDERGH